MWEPVPPPRSTGLSRLFNPITPSHGLVIGTPGSHSSATSSPSTLPPSATESLEHRVSVFPFFKRGAFIWWAAFSPSSASIQSCFKLCFLLVTCRESISFIWPSGTLSGSLGCWPLGWQLDSPLALSFETVGLCRALLYRTNLPRLIILRTIWSEWTRSRWSP